MKVAQFCPAVCDFKNCRLAGSSVHGNSPGKKTEVSSHSRLQGIFPTQESNLGLLYSRQIPPGKPIYYINYTYNIIIKT